MEFDESRFASWLKKSGKAASTVQGYVSAMRLYIERGYKWTYEDACRWKEDEQKRVKPASVNLRIHAINQYAQWTRTRWRLKPVKVQTSRFVEHQLSMAQYNKLLQCLLDDGELRWWAAIKVLAGTGVRISEALQIRREDLKVGYVDVCGKGSKYRRVWFSSKLRQDVLSTFKDEGFILPFSTQAASFSTYLSIHVHVRAGIVAHHIRMI